MSEDAIDFWFCANPDGSLKTVEREELLAGLRQGALTGQSLVWRQGWAEWVAAGRVAELSSALPSTARGVVIVPKPDPDRISHPPPIPLNVTRALDPIIPVASTPENDRPGTLVMEEVELTGSDLLAVKPPPPSRASAPPAPSRRRTPAPRCGSWRQRASRRELDRGRRPHQVDHLGTHGRRARATEGRRAHRAGRLESAPRARHGDAGRRRDPNPRGGRRHSHRTESQQAAGLLALARRSRGNGRGKEAETGSDDRHLETRRASARSARPWRRSSRRSPSRRARDRPDSPTPSCRCPIRNSEAPTEIHPAALRPDADSLPAFGNQFHPAPVALPAPPEPTAWQTPMAPAAAPSYGPPPVAAYPSYAPPKKKSALPWVIGGLGAVGLFGAVAAAALFYFKPWDTEAAATAKPSADARPVHKARHGPHDPEPGHRQAGHADLASDSAERAALLRDPRRQARWSESRTESPRGWA